MIVLGNRQAGSAIGREAAEKRCKGDVMMGEAWIQGEGATGARGTGGKKNSVLFRRVPVPAGTKNMGGVF